MAERIGIIDLGSNSSRLIIYDIYSDGSYRPVFEMKQNVRLAQNMTHGKLISPDGIARAVSCTKLFYHAGTLHGVTHWVPVATAAIRQARNRDEVLATLEAEANMTFRVLDGQEEGRYGYLGVVNTLDIKDVVVFDIGGASSELMLVQDRELVDVTSVPYGALNLTEMFRTSPDTGEKVRAFMNEAFSSVDLLQRAKGLPMVGLGGSARAVAKLDVWYESGQLERVHGYPLRPEEVRHAYQQLSGMPVVKRRKIKGLSKSRADILVAGLAAIVALFDQTDPPELLISRNGLREGIFYEYLLKGQPKAIVPNVLEHSVHNFQRIFHVNKQVAGVVTNAALKLFDMLAPVHQLSEVDRKLLQVTAQIESCGAYINTEKWSRHSAYLAISSHLYGMSYAQLIDVANLLNGRGGPNLQKLLLIIRLAKLMTLNLGIVPDLMFCSMTNTEVRVGRAPRIRETIHASADADLDSEFARLFGVQLVYEDFLTDTSDGAK